jgi:cytochrome b561
MNKPDRYGGVAQAFHWIVAILVLVSFIYGPGGSEERVYSHARDSDRQLHETLGLLVFGVTGLRVMWRMLSDQPDPSELPKWMGIASSLIQGLLYALLFAIPLTAITGAWLEGHPLTLVGNVPIPPLLPESHELGQRIAELHTWLGDAIMWLAGLHALAAIYHHFVLRDGVLLSMLPRRRSLRHR